MSNKQLFSKVRAARELLRERAQEIIEQYMEVARQAQDSGDYETAAKALQWLIEHMPTEEDGTRVVEVSVDKQQQQIQAPTGPSIQIGIQVGGVGRQKELPPAEPAEIIDVKPE